MSFKIIKQGAEAKIFIGDYLGQPTIIKERFVKAYRHPELDNLLTKDRIKAEARALVRCKAAGIRTPCIYLVDFDRRRIYMEYINEHQTVKDFLKSAEEKATDFENINSVAKEIGKVIGLMHAQNIVHGDLTTSNILMTNKYDELNSANITLTLIDFGLAHVEPGIEDKGVDLYVLERALLSTHRIANKLIPIIFETYKKTYKKGAAEVMVKYEDVRARGRKRTMVG